MTVRRDGVLLAAVWLFTAVGQASVQSPTDVKIVEGRVQIHATTTPVSAILDRLSRATGMKVVYEGAPPTDRLTANIDAHSETEALSRLLEGLGLTYAFKLDASGRHVETLLITTSPSGTRRASAPSSRMPPPVFTPAGQDGDEDTMAAEETPLPEPDPSADQGTAGGAPGMGPGYIGSLPTTEGTPVSDPQSPGFPGAASYPSTPGGPYPIAPPLIPGPASFPAP